MRFLRITLVIFLSFLLNNLSIAKNPSDLINDIVNEAASVLKSSDPVESKIIKLNDIAERSVDIDGIGMYALGKHKKTMSDEHISSGTFSIMQQVCVQSECRSTEEDQTMSTSQSKCQ